MRKITLLFLFFLGTFIATAQTFSGATGAIPDNNCDVTNEYIATVAGVGVLQISNAVFEEVVININHSFTDDLDITLIAPDGTEVELSTDNGGAGDNYTDTRFRADAELAITEASAPFTGSFLPEGDFSVLDGLNADGDWILRVCDDFVGDEGTVDSWQITFRSLNDDPATAQSLTVGNIFSDEVVTSTNESSTASEVADPTIPAPGCANYLGGDLWYTVVVPEGGALTIETNRDGVSPIIDTGIAVYSGAIGALVLVECDDNDSDNGPFLSRIDLEGQTPGETLYIRVWSNGNATTGTFQISAWNTTPPVNDDPAGAISLIPGVDFADNAVVGTNVGATASELTDPSIEDPGCSLYSGGDIWYSVVVPSTGDINIETDAQTGSDLADTGLAVYSGDIGALALVACNTDDGNALFSLIELTGRTPGETLYIRVWELGNDTFGEFQISAWPPPPSNDEPTEAIALTVGADFDENAIMGTNISATASEVTDPSIEDPSCGGYNGGDVWYSVVIPASGNINIETALDEGSPVTDTGLNVYSGDIGALVSVACNDDGGGGLFSLTSLSGRTPGETLYIRVWEFGNNDFGSFQVSAWAPPLTNDEPDNAIALTVGENFADEAIIIDNVDATASEVLDPSIPAPGCANYQGGDIWYTVVVPDSGELVIETGDQAGSPIIDTGIAVYSGDIGAFALIMCDDFDSDNGPFLSRIDLSGQTAGETLYIRVWENGNDAFGAFQLSAWAIMAPVNDEPTESVSLTPGADFDENAIVGTNANATASEATDPSIEDPGCSLYTGGDVWYSVVVPVTGNINIETDAQFGSDLLDTGLAIYDGDIGTLTLVACNTDDGNGLFSLIELTDRTPGETLYIRVWELGNDSFGEFQISAWTPAPANDDPAAAIPLTVGIDFDTNAIVSTNIGATASEATDPSIGAPSCGGYSGGDVWYSVVVPEDGNITIETNSDGSGSITDTGLNVYSRDIGALVSIECNDDDSDDGLFSLITLSGRTPGETLYIRVWEFSNNAFGTFRVSAWNPTVLSNDDFDLTEFNYYPNPVKHMLHLNAAKTISNVSIYNLSGKAISKITPKTPQWPLDMSALPSGTYLVKVVIDGKQKTFKILKE